MKCSTCREEIADGAKKCIHCNSFQNFRRFFSFSSTFLSLMVALFSVLGLVTPIIGDALTPKDARIVFSVAYADRDVLYLLAGNEGKKAGVITEAWLIHYYRGHPGFGAQFVKRRYFVACYEKNSGVLSARSDKQIALQQHGKFFPLLEGEQKSLPDLDKQEYRLRVFYKTADGISGYLDVVSDVEPHKPGAKRSALQSLAHGPRLFGDHNSTNINCHA